MTFVLVACGTVETEPVDAALLEDAEVDSTTCAIDFAQQPPCMACCQKFVQAASGPICPVCRILISVSATAEPAGMCETDHEACCSGVYQGVCP